MIQRTLSAGIIPFMKTSSGTEYLLLRSYSYWDFPKGMVEDGEDPWLAAVRELEEETGLNKFKTPFGQIFIETEPYAKGKVARYYLAEIIGDGTVRLLPNPITGIVEHHAYKWMSFEEAAPKVGPRVLKVLEWAQKEIS